MRYFIILMLLGAACAWGDGVVTGVKVEETGGGVRLRLAITRAVHYRTRVLSRNLLAIDVSPARLGAGLVKKVPIRRGLLGDATVRQLDAKTVRLQVSAISLPAYKGWADARGVTLQLSTATMAPAPWSARRWPRHPVPAPPGYASQKRLTVDFVQADLVDVVKVLAKQMGRNVYIGPGVEGSVTVSLIDVPAQAALAMILPMQENELAYKLVGANTFIVAAPETDTQIEPFESRWGQKPPANSVRQEVLLEIAPAAKVIGFLQGYYKNVEFIPHPTMNGFYVVGSRDDVEAIENDIPNLDRIPDPPPTSTREFVQVKYGDLNEVKALLQTLVPDVQIAVDSQPSTLLLEGAPGAVEQAMELIDQLDKPLDQVVMECKLVDLTDTMQKILGITWASPASIPCRTSETLGLSGSPLGPPDWSPAAFTPRWGKLSRTLAFQANLNFLISTSHAGILSSPRVAAQSGTKAQIYIGDKFPLVYFDAQAGEFRHDQVDLGVRLDMTSTLRSDGSVVCKIAPQVTTLVDVIDGQYALTRVRRLVAEVRIQDGETLVLGGMWDAEDLERVKTIPLLGDLPILGGLFRNTSLTTTARQVVLMLSNPGRAR